MLIQIEVEVKPTQARYHTNEHNKIRKDLFFYYYHYYLYHFFTIYYLYYRFYYSLYFFASCGLYGTLLWSVTAVAGR